MQLISTETYEEGEVLDEEDQVEPAAHLLIDSARPIKHQQQHSEDFQFDFEIVPVKTSWDVKKKEKKISKPNDKPKRLDNKKLPQPDRLDRDKAPLPSDYRNQYPNRSSQERRTLPSPTHTPDAPQYLPQQQHPQSAPNMSEQIYLHTHTFQNSKYLQPAQVRPMSSHPLYPSPQFHTPFPGQIRPPMHVQQNMGQGQTPYPQHYAYPNFPNNGYPNQFNPNYTGNNVIAQQDINMMHPPNMRPGMPMGPIGRVGHPMSMPNQSMPNQSIPNHSLPNHSMLNQPMLNQPMPNQPMIGVNSQIPNHMGHPAIRMNPPNSQPMQGMYPQMQQHPHNHPMQGAHHSMPAPMPVPPINMPMPQSMGHPSQGNPLQNNIGFQNLPQMHQVLPPPPPPPPPQKPVITEPSKPVVPRQLTSQLELLQQALMTTPLLSSSPPEDKQRLRSLFSSAMESEYYKKALSDEKLDGLLQLGQQVKGQRLPSLLESIGLSSVANQLRQRMLFVGLVMKTDYEAVQGQLKRLRRL